MKQFNYRSTKTYSHNVGFSAAFRQWRAKSHCHFLHGYPLSFKFEFGTNELDDNFWAVDFGSLKSLKSILENTFDHKTVVAKDDPQLAWFEEGHRLGILDLVILPATGCEKFAEYAFGLAEKWLIDAGFSPRCTLISVEVREHESNSAIYYNPEVL